MQICQGEWNRKVGPVNPYSERKQWFEVIIINAHNYIKRWAVATHGCNGYCNGCCKLHPFPAKAQHCLLWYEHSLFSWLLLIDAGVGRTYCTVLSPVLSPVSHQCIFTWQTDPHFVLFSWQPTLFLAPVYQRKGQPHLINFALQHICIPECHV